MIFGIAATKSAVVIAETKGTGNKFAITAIRSMPFEVQSGDHLAELLRCLTTIFGRGALPQIKRHRRGVKSRGKSHSLPHGRKTPKRKRCIGNERPNETTN